MSRYIDADLLKNLILNDMAKAEREEKDLNGYTDALFHLKTLPTADVVEVRHGEWKYERLDEYKFYKVTCPYCGADYMGNYDAYDDPDDFNFCPNCGAKMDG